MKSTHPTSAAKDAQVQRSPIQVQVHDLETKAEKLGNLISSLVTNLQPVLPLEDGVNCDKAVAVDAPVDVANSSPLGENLRMLNRHFEEQLSRLCAVLETLQL